MDFLKNPLFICFKFFQQQGVITIIKIIIFVFTGSKIMLTEKSKSGNYRFGFQGEFAEKVYPEQSEGTKQAITILS